MKEGAVVSFLKAFCKRVDVPYEKKCPHCQCRHEAQTYTLSNVAGAKKRKCYWFTVDYGRCSGMESEHACLKTCGPVAAKERQAMRDMVRALVGDQ